MIVMRRVKIEVNRPKIGDRIRVGHYTATCQEITPKGALFLLDQYLDKAFPMNWNDTNKGGYPESDLRKALQSDEVLNIFADIRDYMVPFDNGDLLRIPFAGELFDKLSSWCEPDSTLSDMLRDVLEYLEREKESLKKTHVISLMDICEFERSRKGKTYKAGSITIQVSATRGQMSFLESDGKVEPKDGVFEVTDKCVYPKYLYYVMRLAMPHFLERFQTGLNINPEIFKMMRLKVHTDQNTQKTIADILDKFEMLGSTEDQAAERLKDVKKYHLENMFC